MSLEKLKNVYFLGSLVKNVKGMYDKINEIIDYLNGASGDGSYKVYTALLTQSGATAPIAIVLKNTLGDITWKYNITGNYEALSNNLFNSTTAVIHKSLVGDDAGYKLISYSIIPSSISFSTFDTNTPANDVLTSELIEIRVYN